MGAGCAGRGPLPPSPRASCPSLGRTSVPGLAAAEPVENVFTLTLAGLSPHTRLLGHKVSHTVAGHPCTSLMREQIHTRTHVHIDVPTS